MPGVPALSMGLKICGIFVTQLSLQSGSLNDQQLGTQNQNEMSLISALTIMFDPQNWQTEKPTIRERIKVLLMKIKKHRLL